jgi:D-3-phosphoglycerate dehydrogenase
LLGHERVVCTPHLGASTQEAQIGVAVAVAEQVAAFAQGAGARNALNLPRLDTKSSKKLSSLIDTAERAAAMCAQITRGKPTAIEVILHGGGDSALMQPLGTAACVAVLRQSLGGSVNMVNGRLNADERGMSVVESRTEQPVLGYSNAIEVRVSGEDTHHVIATQFGNGETRVVAVDGVRLEAVPEGEILLIANKDMPGAVGQIGSILGDNGINISRMQLGLHAESGNALTAVNVDRSVPLEVVSALESIEQVVAVSAISL